jgi:hypothetical protein
LAAFVALSIVIVLAAPLELARVNTPTSVSSEVTPPPAPPVQAAKAN